MLEVTTPLSEETVIRLRAGDEVRITGSLFTARDAAHERIRQALVRGEPAPFELRGQIIYYAGPTPARPGKPIGSCGPTTSRRMDPYVPLLLEHGLGGMLGKGRRSPEVIEAIARHRAVYFVTIGGAGALLSRFVLKAEVVAYPDLGPEAVYRLDVKDFPAVVAIDAQGNDLFFQTNPWRRS